MEPKIWYSLCTASSGCCPEYGLTEDGVFLREDGVVIKLTNQQWEFLSQQRRLSLPDRNSQSRS